MNTLNKKIFDNYQLWVLFAIGLLYHMSILPPVETGQDSVRKFLMMKSLQWDLIESYWKYDHHSSRWSINIPISIYYYLFPNGVNTYYFSAWTAMLGTIYFLYQLTKKHLNSNFAILACLSFIFFAQYTRNANQLVPAIFSNVYIIGSYYFLDRFFDNKSKISFCLSIVFIFAAYLAKIDNLYFLPGFLFAIYIYTKNIKTVFAYGSILFGLYLLETGCYALFSDYPGGRLQVIMGAHLKSPKLTVGISFLQIFDKILVAGSPLIYFLGFFFLYTPFVIKKRKNISNISLALCITIFIYYFLKLFILKKYNPIIPLEINKERYLLAPVPFLLIFTYKEFYTPLFNKISNIDKKYFTGFILVILIYLIGNNTLQLVDNKHRLQTNYQWRSILNEAYADEIPIMSDYDSSLQNVYRFYLHKDKIVQNNYFIHSKNFIDKLPDKKGYWVIQKEKNFQFFSEFKDQCHILIEDKYYKFKVVNCGDKFQL